MKLSRGPTIVIWLKGHVVALRMRAYHRKSAPCLIWSSWVFCRWRYNVFNLSSHLTWSPHWGGMRIYGWEFLVLCNYADNFCAHKHCDGWNMFLICHVTSRKYMLKGLCELMGGSPSWWVTILLCLVAIGPMQVEI